MPHASFHLRAESHRLRGWFALLLVLVWVPASAGEASAGADDGSVVAPACPAGELTTPPDRCDRTPDRRRAPPAVAPGPATTPARPGGRMTRALHARKRCAADLPRRARGPPDVRPG